MLYFCVQKLSSLTLVDENTTILSFTSGRLHRLEFASFPYNTRINYALLKCKNLISLSTISCSKAEGLNRFNLTLTLG